MEEKNYCPVCGHAFVQGEGDYNYETSLIDYICSNCGWEGTDVLDIDTIIADISDEIDNEGIEVTEEDAMNVLEELEFYDTYEEAVKSVAKGILDCLGII